MNSEEYDKLTADEKQIKVAELNGFEDIRVRNMGDPLTGYRKSLASTRPLEEVPDYLNDLDACYEFEKLIPDTHLDRYFGHVTGDAYSCWMCESSDAYWSLLHVSAEAKCKAFVLTMTGETT